MVKNFGSFGSFEEYTTNLSPSYLVYRTRFCDCSSSSDISGCGTGIKLARAELSHSSGNCHADPPPKKARGSSGPNKILYSVWSIPGSLDQKLRWIQPPLGRIQGSPTTGTRWGNGVAIAQPSVSGPGVAVTTTTAGVTVGSLLGEEKLISITPELMSKNIPPMIAARTAPVQPITA